jgi:hypothetical protein
MTENQQDTMPDTIDDRGHSTTRGLWSNKDVPHKGWTNVAMDDRGPDDCNWYKCDMCLCTPVRYAHVMEHPNYLYPLAVGSICAGNMEEDYIVAERREHNLKARRKNWLAQVPGFTDESWQWALGVDALDVANAIAETLPVPRNFRGLVICRACDREGWRAAIWRQSRIPLVQISTITTGGRGIPPTASDRYPTNWYPTNWTIISYQLVRKPQLQTTFVHNH